MVDDPLLADLPKAKRRWARTDPILHAIVKATPPPPRALANDDPFHALVTSIAHQQVSLAAGRAIRGRVDAAPGGRATPDGILRAGPEALRAAGLSRPKVAYVLDLAAKAEGGEVELARFRQMEDADIIRELVAVKGIGVWTAKKFLLFHLDRPDVSVPEDLGIQIAVAQAYGVRRDRAAKKAAQLAPLWSPYNSLANMTLWNWRRTPA
jgi:DNA-3-methyladenine glycosylase II